jgi:hypothetical protein
MHTAAPPQKGSENSGSSLRPLHDSTCRVRVAANSHRGACVTLEAECEQCLCKWRIRMAADIPVVRAVLVGSKDSMRIQLFKRTVHEPVHARMNDMPHRDPALAECDCFMSAHFVSNANMVKGKRYSAFGEPVLLFAADGWVLNWHEMPGLKTLRCWNVSPFDFFDTEDIESQLVVAITSQLEAADEPSGPSDAVSDGTVEVPRHAVAPAE